VAVAALASAEALVVALAAAVLGCAAQFVDYRRGPRAVQVQCHTL
jgi:hypothetical protein